jgi:uncharacterized protein (TIGR02597 family)
MQTRSHTRVLSTFTKLTGIATVGLLIGFAVAPRASADDVVTDPVGFITLTIKGTNGTPSTAAISLQGLGMTQVVTNRGNINGTPTGNAFPVSATLDVNAFSAAGGQAKFFIEVINGAAAGMQDDIVSNSATTVFTGTNLVETVAANGDQYKIYPHWTIASVFGPNNEVGLKPGSSVTGDQILILNPLTGGYDTYYRSNLGFPTGTGWRKAAAGSADMSNVTLYMDQGLLMRRLEGTNVVALLVGAVKLGQTVIPVAHGYNIVANVYPITNLTLGVSTLSNVVAAGSSVTADLILIHNPSTQGYDTYYFSNLGFPTGAGWRKAAAGSVDQSGVALPLGGSVYIQRKAAGGFNWVVPQIFTP